MLQLDSISNLSMGIDDVCALDSSRVSNPKAFKAFAHGIHLTGEFLLNDRWQTSIVSDSYRAPFDFIMHEMLPEIYDPEYLESQGGQFGIRLSGIGDYTVASINKRVIVMQDLPLDLRSGEEVLDLEMSPDVFMAYARGLLLNLSEEILEEDDEFENRPISNLELQLYGMPAGGQKTALKSMEAAGTDLGHTLSSNSIGALTAAGAVGNISRAGDKDWYAIHLERGRTYQFDLKGSRSNEGTLVDPYLRGIYDSNGKLLPGTSNDDSGAGLEARLGYTAAKTGIHYVEAGAFGSRMGTYHLTAEIIKSTEGAGYDFGNTLTTDYIGTLSTLGGAASAGVGTISSPSDRDWFAVYLEQGRTYQFEMKGKSSNEGTLHDPYLRGIYDSNGKLLPGTRNDDSGVGLDARLSYTAAKTGIHYVEAGAFNWSWNTGTYNITAKDLSNPSVYEHSISRETLDYGSSLNSKNIGTVSEAGTYGVLDRPFDRDWYSVHLYAGQNYQVDMLGIRTGAGTLRNPYLRGIYDSQGKLLPLSSDNNGGKGFDARLTFKPGETGIYYIEAGAFGDGAGGYQLQVHMKDASNSNGGEVVAVSSASVSSFCGANFSPCGAANGIFSPCGVNASGCGANAPFVSPCVGNASACAGNTSILSPCSANASGCVAKASIISPCAANASGCGANASFVTPCGSNASGCGANASGIGPCGLNASGCGANVSGCGVLVGGCAVNLPGDIISICVINIIPILPSC